MSNSGNESTDSHPEPLCWECAEDHDAEYEEKGRFRNSPGRRTSARCEECGKPLGTMYRPVEVA